MGGRWHGRTIGISYAVEVGHCLALGVQDLHLLIYRHEATPVSLHPQSSQVQALENRQPLKARMSLPACATIPKMRSTHLFDGAQHMQQQMPLAVRMEDMTCVKRLPRCM